MPIARIRSFDPEAIAFLAAQLAQSGYTLQFVRPDETGLPDADLELTVVRRDLDGALHMAQEEAERLGVDVTVMPGVIPKDLLEPALATPPIPQILEPISLAADIPEPAPFPSDIEMPTMRQTPVVVAHEISNDAEVERQWAAFNEGPLDKGARIFGRGLNWCIEGLEAASNSLGLGIAHGRETLAQIGKTTAQLPAWKVRVRIPPLGRQLKQLSTFAPVMAGSKNLRRPKPLWLRERIYKGAAIAAILAVAAMLGWTFAGYGGPANPVGKASGISTVKEQVPFGPASASAPVAAVVPVRASQKAEVKPATTRSERHARAARANRDDDQEVIVRHFDRKPATEQARSKSHDPVVRDGVKIISEE